MDWDITEIPTYSFVMFEKSDSKQVKKANSTLIAFIVK